MRLYLHTYAVGHRPFVYKFYLLRFCIIIVSVMQREKHRALPVKFPGISNAYNINSEHNGTARAVL